MKEGGLLLLGDSGFIALYSSGYAVFAVNHYNYEPEFRVDHIRQANEILQQHSEFDTGRQLNKQHGRIMKYIELACHLLSLYTDSVERR